MCVFKITSIERVRLCVSRFVTGNRRDYSDGKRHKGTERLE